MPLLVVHIPAFRRPSGTGIRQVVTWRGRRVVRAAWPDEPARGIRETRYLLSIPGMLESIREGMAIPLDQLHEDLEW